MMKLGITNSSRFGYIGNIFGWPNRFFIQLQYFNKIYDFFYLFVENVHNFTSIHIKTRFFLRDHMIF